MSLAPVIFPFCDPVSSLNAHLEGSGSIDASGFIFSPSGGTFASGSVSGVMGWEYDFILMDTSEVFSIATFDASGNVSPSASVVINYELHAPLILSPGDNKVLTDNIAITGSTNSTFITLAGDFKDDGVILGDKVLATSGKNINTIKSITALEDTFLNTDPFPFSWDAGDEIRIYPKEDRETFNANRLRFESSGIVDESAEEVLFSTTGFEEIRVYSEIDEPYDIDGTNDAVHIIVDGEERTIFLTHGDNRTAQSLINEINSNFTADVAFIELNPLTNLSTFYISGTVVEILSASANDYFNFCEGRFLFARTLTPTGEDIAPQDCVLDLTEDDSRLVDLNIDGNIIRFELEPGEEINIRDIGDLINAQADDCVVSLGTSTIVLLAGNNLNINNTIDRIGMLASAQGLSTVNNNDGNQNSDWNLDFRVFQNEMTMCVVALDPFFRLSSESCLDIVYQIDPPTLDPNLQIDDGVLAIDQNIVTLNGNFDSEGDVVQINGVDVFSTNGGFSEDLGDLDEGENLVEVQTLDIFGNPSNVLRFSIVFINPNTTLATLQPSSGGLQWKALTTPSFVPEDVKKVMDAIDSVFSPIIGLLELISGILKIARAFIQDNIVSFLNVVRNAIQSFVDDILEILDNLVNGAGIFIISTIPKAGDVRDAQEFINRIQVPFDSFVDTLVRSFDDPLDPFRPQLSSNVVTGGYALAVADTGGILDFLRAISEIQRIVEKEVLDYGLSSPKNLKISNQNKRCVITWESPDGLRPGNYVIKRSTVAGGVPRFKKVKIGVSAPGISKFRDERELDSVTGEFLTDYTTIGTLNDLQVLKEFRFIDGVSTAQEKKEDNVAKSVVNGATGFLDAFRDSILVVQGSTEKPLTNGQTFYYKVFPTFVGSDVEGQSFELIGTPSNPELEFVEEFLNDQITRDVATKGTGIRYTLSGAIFDKNTAVTASEPFSDHLEVLVDGGKITPTNVIPSKGIVDISPQNIPSNTIKFSYWTKKRVSATRAVLTGKNSGDFTFKKSDTANHTLSILVGVKSSTASNVGAGISGATTIELTQTITIVRDFLGNDERTFTATALASIIRSQTAGLRVVTNRLNQIVLIDDQNPDIYFGSQLKITKGNTVLGFSDVANELPFINHISVAGPIGGTPPDWFRISVADLFPIINDMIRFIKSITDQFLKSLESATNALTDFIDLLLQKIEALQDIAERIRDLIKEAANILTVKGGFFFLQIPAQTGGNTYLKEALFTSTNRPNSDFTAGVLIVYGDGATQKAIDFIFKPIAG